MKTTRPRRSCGLAKSWTFRGGVVAAALILTACGGSPSQQAAPSTVATSTADWRVHADCRDPQHDPNSAYPDEYLRDWSGDVDDLTTDAQKYNDALAGGDGAEAYNAASELATVVDNIAGDDQSADGKPTGSIYLPISFGCYDAHIADALTAASSAVWDPIQQIGMGASPTLNADQERTFATAFRKFVGAGNVYSAQFGGERITADVNDPAGS